MLKGPRKWLMTAFIIATVAVSVAMSYSLSEYLGISIAVRSLHFSVGDFTFEIPDSGHVRATTTLILNNTSSYSFLVVGLHQRVLVNGEYFVGVSEKEGISTSNPLQLLGRSSQNVSLILSVDLAILETSSPELVELLITPSMQKSWQIYADASMDGPLIGRFSMFAARDTGAAS